MEEKLVFEYSGELVTEIRETKKLCHMEDVQFEVEKKVTSTLGCGSFLTIYCC